MFIIIKLLIADGGNGRNKQITGVLLLQVPGNIGHIESNVFRLFEYSMVEFLKDVRP
ncbi:hypothetical protein [Paraflavitalea speifideaquila]|uniref:hypothetical protein n=1 Tax=Paraflavitalea speifideaquila TaxID=3076558 RepID=UPI0028E2132E|nr:hypothetical protein [Paraflavitalea speifideiaquila]